MIELFKNQIIEHSEATKVAHLKASVTIKRVVGLEHLPTNIIGMTSLLVTTFLFKLAPNHLSGVKGSRDHILGSDHSLVEVGCEP